MKKEKPVTVYLDKNTFEHLHFLKNKECINISSFIALAVKEKLEKEKPLET